MLQEALPCPWSRWEAAEHRWRPLATIETPLELGMLKPLEVGRDGPLDLIFEKENHLSRTAGAQGARTNLNGHG
jgi:hypothetical protein